MEIHLSYLQLLQMNNYILSETLYHPLELILAIVSVCFVNETIVVSNAVEGGKFRCDNSSEEYSARVANSGFI